MVKPMHLSPLPWPVKSVHQHALKHSVAQEEIMLKRGSDVEQEHCGKDIEQPIMDITGGVRPWRILRGQIGQRHSTEQPNGPTTTIRRRPAQ
jgi:hypothetical protein